MADPNAPRRLRPTKGVHLIVPRDRIRSKAAITLNSPRDGRLMFLIPWGQFSVIGTTDTDYEGDPADVHADAADVAYILEAARLMKVQRVVYTSAKGIYGHIEGEYAHPTFKPLPEDK
jgi:glycerol-3-phosphate dehydrogenase